MDNHQPFETVSTVAQFWPTPLLTVAKELSCRRTPFVNTLPSFLRLNDNLSHFYQGWGAGKFFSGSGS